MFNRLCLGAILLVGLVLSFNGCNASSTSGTSGLTTIVISPNTVSVELAPPGYQQGQSQFTAIGYYGHAGHQSTRDITSEVTWSSSGSQVATISKTGLAAATGFDSQTGEGWVGNTNITASAQGYNGDIVSNTATFTVTDCKSCTNSDISAVTVSPATQTVTTLNVPVQFQALGKTVSGDTVVLNGKSGLSWSSSLPTVAPNPTVDGKTSTSTAGTTTITASFTNSDRSGASGTATLVVAPSTTSSSEPFVSMAIYPGTQTLAAVGQQAKFLAIGTSSTGSTVDLTNGINNKGITWSSSDGNGKIVKLAGNGLFTAVGNGAVVITAVFNNSAANGSSTDLTSVLATAALTVTTGTTSSSEPLTAVTIYPPSPSVSAPGESSQLLAIGTFSITPTTQDITNGLAGPTSWTDNNPAITTSWSSSNTAVATVTTACPTGITAESCTLYACPAGSTGATCTTCATLPETTVASGSSCAQLNLATPIGTVTGVDKGSTEIMAIAENPSGNLVPASTSFSVLGGSSETYTALNIYPGSQSATAPAQQTQFLVLGTNGTTGLANDVTSLVQWCSSNPTVATIESKVKGSASCSNVVGTSPGLATAVGAGSTTFTVTYTDPNNGGVVITTASYNVTIGAAQEPLISIDVVPGDTTVSNKGMTQQYLAFGTFTTTPTLRDITDSVTWISLEPNLVSINSAGTSGEQAGLATAMGYEGTSVIYAEDTTSNPDGTTVLSNSVTFTCKDQSGACDQAVAPALLATLTAFNAGSNDTNWLITAPSDNQIAHGITTCTPATGCLIHCGPGSATAGYGNSVCTGTYAAGTNVTLTASLAGNPLDKTFGGWTANCDTTVNTPNMTATCTFPNAATPSGLVGNQSAGALFYGLTLSCSSVTSGTVGVAFDSLTPTASGGTAPYTYSVEGTLPAGLTLTASTGEVTGTPTAAGSFSLTATDADGVNAATACAITINK
jgi:hypothetical protein